MARHQLILKAEKIYKQLIKLVGSKFPKSVQVVGSSNLGQKKTKVLSVKIEGDEVIVTFKDSLWGSKTYVAGCVRDGIIIFDVARALGRGEDPHFTIKN
jgi:hypothetical protein